MILPYMKKEIKSTRKKLASEKKTKNCRNLIIIINDNNFHWLDSIINIYLKLFHFDKKNLFLVFFELLLIFYHLFIYIFSIFA